MLVSTKRPRLETPKTLESVSEWSDFEPINSPKLPPLVVRVIATSTHKTFVDSEVILFFIVRLVGYKKNPKRTKERCYHYYGKRSRGKNIGQYFTKTGLTKIFYDVIVDEIVEDLAILGKFEEVTGSRPYEKPQRRSYPIPELQKCSVELKPFVSKGAKRLGPYRQS